MRIAQRMVRSKPRRNFSLLERRRRSAMKLFTKGVSQAEVARRCGVSETTAFRWKRAWVSRGPDAWRRGRLGRPPKAMALERKPELEPTHATAHHPLVGPRPGNTGRSCLKAMRSR